MTKERQRQIIQALISFPTRREACKALGIAERTLYNYMQDEAFINAYKAAIEDILRDTDTRLKEAALCAINHLISVVEDENIDALTRIKADRIILEHMTKKIECDNKYW